MIKISNDLLTSKKHNTLEETINNSISSALHSQEDDIQLEDLGNPDSEVPSPIYITSDTTEETDEQYDEDEALLDEMAEEEDLDESDSEDSLATYSQIDLASDEEEIDIDDEEDIDILTEEPSENEDDDIDIDAEQDAEADFDEQLLESLDIDDDEELETSKEEKEEIDQHIDENLSDTPSKIAYSLEQLDSIEYSEEEEEDFEDAEEKTENSEEDMLDVDPEFAGLSLDDEFEDDDDDAVVEYNTSTSEVQPARTVTIDLDDDDIDLDDDDEDSIIETMSAQSSKNSSADDTDDFDVDDLDMDDDDTTIKSPALEHKTQSTQKPVVDHNLVQLEQENERLKAQLLAAENAKLQAQLKSLQQQQQVTTQTVKQPVVSMNTGVVTKKQPTQTTEQPKTAQNKEQERLQRWQRYSQMATSDLWKIVFKFMTAFGVREHPIKQSLLEQEFGPACVKKLEQSYIIKTKDGYTC